MSNNTNNTDPILRTNAEEEYNAKHAEPIDPETGKNPNYLLAKNLFMSMDMKKAKQNRNVLLIGNNTSETNEHLKNNILQGNSSMVINDSTGYLFKTCAESLKEKGYTVKIFSDTAVLHPVRYNPFRYVYNYDRSVDENKIKQISEILCDYVCNFMSDPDWRGKAYSMIALIICFCIESNQDKRINFGTIYKTLSQGYDRFKVDIQNLQKESFRDNRVLLANKYYADLSLTSDITRFQIWEMIRLCLYKLNQEPLKSLLEEDLENEQNNIRLDHILDKKTALFIVFARWGWGQFEEYVYAILYSQIFNYVMERSAYHSKNNVQFYLNDVSNIGHFPNLPGMLAVCSNRNVGCTVCTETIEELRLICGGNWEIIPGNCDTLIYMGGDNENTNKYVSTLVGTKTISSSATAKFISKMTGGAWADKKVYKPLIAPDEMYRIKKNQCLVIPRGENPILAYKM